MNDDHIDVGSGMKYCEIHKCWWPIKGHCEGCGRTTSEIAKVARCVEEDGVSYI